MWKRLYGTCVRLVEALEHFRVTFSVSPTPGRSTRYSKGWRQNVLLRGKEGGLLRSPRVAPPYERVSGVHSGPRDTGEAYISNAPTLIALNGVHSPFI